MANVVELGAAFTGAQIKEIRLLKKLELKDMQSLLKQHTGKELGLSTLSRMETGKGRGPTVEELLAFALILDATPDRLLFGGRELKGCELRLTRDAAYQMSDVWAWAGAWHPLGWFDRMDRILAELKTGPSIALMHRRLTPEEKDELEAQRARQQADFAHRKEFLELNRVSNPPSDTPDEVIERARASQSYQEFMDAVRGLLGEGLTLRDVRDVLHTESMKIESRDHAHDDEP